MDVSLTVPLNLPPRLRVIKLVLSHHQKISKFGVEQD
jgi:hypothetical protein